MCDYGIKVGCYVIKNEVNDNGLLLHIKSLTRKFVEVDTYNYYDNKTTYEDVKHKKLHHKCFKKKMVKERDDGGSLYFNNGVELKLTDDTYNGDMILWDESQDKKAGEMWNKLTNMIKDDYEVVEVVEVVEEQEEQEPLPDDGTAENDEEEQAVNFYKKEIEKLCPPCHLTKWCDTTGNYTYYINPEWKAKCLNTLTDDFLNLNKGDGYHIMENIRIAKKLLTNSDRFYRSDVILINKLCKVLQSKFFKENRFNTELKVY